MYKIKKCRLARTKKSHQRRECEIVGEGVRLNISSYSILYTRNTENKRLVTARKERDIIMFFVFYQIYYLMQL